MFLSNYCSDKVKARYSILNNKKYLPFQFLAENSRHVIHNNICLIEYILFQKYIHVIKLEIYDIDNFILLEQLSKPLKNIIEYIAYPPNIIIEGTIKIPPLTNFIKWFRNNELYIINNNNFIKVI